MSTDREPTFTVKLLQLLLLSTYWGMQIWVTFISSWYQAHTHTHTQKYEAKEGGGKVETQLGCIIFLGHMFSRSMLDCFKTNISLHKPA